MTNLTLPLMARAPAKVNLILYVGGRRAGDHRHELCSLFQSVTLADELVMESAPGSEGDEVVCPGVPAPNLAAEALARFRSELGWDSEPLRVTIRKRIPVAAGLGGGSADAAAVLRLAHAASGLDVDERLVPLAMSLSADVPSQLAPGTHLVTGAGEVVEPVEAPTGIALLILSGVAALGTGLVYDRADRLGLPERDLPSLALRLRRELGSALKAPERLAALVENDLEPAALYLEPSIVGALALLRDSGALAAAVSGSGPSTFGIYSGRHQAEEARRAVARAWPGDVVVAEPAGAGYGAPLPAATASA
jgi:4-diphosphocytidyl-2-C-methyl-D-erythritol kinase